MTEKDFFNGMNRAGNPSNLNETEKKHIPVIDLPTSVNAGEPFNVTVTVGSILHVMEPAHHIQWIDLYAGENFVSRVLFTPGFTEAKVTMTLVRESPGTVSMRAVERCNIHGLWENSRDITVK